MGALSSPSPTLEFFIDRSNFYICILFVVMVQLAFVSISNIACLFCILQMDDSQSQPGLDVTTTATVGPSLSAVIEAETKSVMVSAAASTATPITITMGRLSRLSDDCMMDVISYLDYASHQSYACIHRGMTGIISRCRRRIHLTVSSRRTLPLVPHHLAAIVGGIPPEDHSSDEKHMVSLSTRSHANKRSGMVNELVLDYVPTPRLRRWRLIRGPIGMYIAATLSVTLLAHSMTMM